MATPAPELEPLLGKAPVPDLSKEEALEKCGVTEFKGFWENQYRLLFAFEDHYPGQSPKLLTILPSGKVENEKTLKPEMEKGLVAYGYPQKLNQDQVEEIRREYGEAVDSFIIQRNDGELGLVRTWAVKYNTEFKGRCQVLDENPTPLKFQPQAVEEFQKAMIKLFGQSARGHVKYAFTSQKNESSVYIGTGEQVINLLKSCSQLRKELDIAEVFDGHGETGFAARITNKKEGYTGNKKFQVAKDQMTTLYSKKGFDSMACSKPLPQFEYECMPDVGKDEGIIPNVLLATPLPTCAYDAEVCKLFFNDQKLLVDATEIPNPIPIDSCCGPALWWARARATVLWTQVLVSALLAVLAWRLFGTRLKDWHGSMWVPFACSALFGLYAEWQCVKHFIVPWVQQVHGCIAPLIGKQRFEVWLGLMTVATIVAMVNIQTNALFVINAFQSASENEIWAHVMKGSLFRFLGVEWEVFNPGWFCLIFWVISTFQLWLPLLCTSPLPGHPKIDYSVKYYGKDEVEWTTIGEKLRLRLDPIKPFEALAELAYASGMATVGCCVFSYPLGKMHDTLRQQNADWEYKSMEYLQMAQRAACRRLLVDAFLKKTLMLKMQVSLYAIHRATAIQQKRDDTFLLPELLPIIMTLLTGLATQVDVVYMCYRRYFEVSAAIRHRHKFLTDAGKDSMRTLIINNFLIFGLTLLCMWGIGYSVMQLFAMYHCDTSLWNWAWPLNSGCVPRLEIPGWA